MSQEKGKKISSSIVSFLAPLKVTIMVSAGSRQRFRFMWAAIPFDVADVALLRRCGAAEDRPNRSGFRGWLDWRSALLFHSRHLGAKRFPGELGGTWVRRPRVPLERALSSERDSRGMVCGRSRSEHSLRLRETLRSE